MSYRVVWEDTCSEGIENALDAGESARTVLRAVQEIEARLGGDPYRHGAELSEELRTFDESPLRVYYYIEASERLVKVVAVRRLTAR
jgi:hypothetical protein